MNSKVAAVTHESKQSHKIEMNHSTSCSFGWQKGFTVDHHFTSLQDCVHTTCTNSRSLYTPDIRGCIHKASWPQNVWCSVYREDEQISPIREVLRIITVFLHTMVKWLQQAVGALKRWIHLVKRFYHLDKFGDFSSLRRKLRCCI